MANYSHCNDLPEAGAGMRVMYVRPFAWKPTPRWLFWKPRSRRMLRLFDRTGQIVGQWWEYQPVSVVATKHYHAWLHDVRTRRAHTTLPPVGGLSARKPSRY